MVNILLESYNLDADWLYDELKEYLKPEYKVAVVAFSFHDSRVKNNKVSFMVGLLALCVLMVLKRKI